jgi:hypothetical protein
MKKLALLVTGALVVLATALAPGLGAAGSAIPYKWKNCTIVNKRFPHGVGKLRAHDKTSGVPVNQLPAQHPALPQGDALQPRA